MTEWQAMESAPKDRDTLLYVRKDHEAYVGYWSGKCWYAPTPQTGLEEIEPDLWADFQLPEAG